jgi:hypothetical protein
MQQATQWLHQQSKLIWACDNPPEGCPGIISGGRRRPVLNELALRPGISITDCIGSGKPVALCFLNFHRIPKLAKAGSTLALSKEV